MVATGEVKCIDDEIPFEIPQGWEWCRLGEICKFLSRGKSPSYSDVPNQYPVFAQKCNLKNGGISLEQARFLNPNTIDKWPDIFKLKTDDVLVNSTGTGTVCRTRLFHENYLGSYPFTVPDSHVSIIRSFEEINSTFLYSLLNSKFIQDYWNDNLAGSTNQKELYIGTIQKTPIPLPPLAEQHRIVSKIEELMPLVDEYGKSEEELKALNASLPEALKKSILQEAIQGKLVPQIASEGDASVLLQQIEFEKQKLVKEGKLKKKDLVSSTIFRGDDNKYYEQVGRKYLDLTEQIPFETPKNWVWTRLSHIANIYTGNSINETEKKSKFTDVVGRYYIGTKDVDFNNRIIYDNGIAIPKQYEQDFRIASNNSILMCIEGGSAGRKIAILNQDVCFGNKLCCFSPFVGIGKYIYYYLLSPSFFEMFNQNKTGIIGGVSIAKVKEILIPLPPIKEQQRIVAQIEKLFEQLR